MRKVCRSNMQVSTVPRPMPQPELCTTCNPQSSSAEAHRLLAGWQSHTVNVLTHTLTTLIKKLSLHKHCNLICAMVRSHQLCQQVQVWSWTGRRLMGADSCLLLVKLWSQSGNICLPARWRRLESLAKLF